MVDNLFSGIITSKTRIKLIIRLFMNPEARAYMRELATEFNVSSNAVREELKQLSATRLLKSEKIGRQVFYKSNPDHPLFPELKNMVAKVIGMDQIIDNIAKRLGKLESAYLIGDYAEGKDFGIIDLLLIGKIDHNQLTDLTQKTEKYIKRKIRTLVLSPEEYSSFESFIRNRPSLMIWENIKKDE